MLNVVIDDDVTMSYYHVFVTLVFQRVLDQYQFSVVIGSCPLGFSLQETPQGESLSCRCDAGRKSVDFIGCEGKILILKVSMCVCVHACMLYGHATAIPSFYKIGSSPGACAAFELK